METPKVSIIIPSFNRGWMIGRVLDSLLNQTYKNIEIIIVDDSTDNTGDIVRGYPEVTYIYNTDKSVKGSSPARNIGIKKATGDIVMFTDTDVIATPDLVEVHVNEHLKNDKLIVQGQLVRIIDLDAAYRAPFSMIYYSRAFFDTANVSVRKKYLDMTSGFELPHGWEDLDYGLTLINLGLKVKRLTFRGYVWHYEGDYSKECVHKYFQKRFWQGERGLDFYRKRRSLEVRMMVMAHPFFFGLGRLLYKEKYLLSDEFYGKVKNLIDNGKVGSAVALVMYNSYCFYLKGLENRIKKEGYFL